MGESSDRARRLALSHCMVDILRPCTEADRNVTLNERLVGYAVAIGHYQDAPLGIHKISEMTGLARSTVRSVTRALVERAWIIRRADKTFCFSAEFHANADEWFQLEMKYEAILRAAEGLRAGRL